MSLLKSLSALPLAALIVACSTVPTSAPSYERAPPASGDLVNVYIYRVGAFPSKRTPTISVDEKEVFDPPEGSYTVIQLAPGRHSIATKWSWDTGAPNLSFVVEVPRVKTFYLKLSGDFKAVGLAYRTTSFAKRIEEDVAEEELRNCCKFIASRY